MRETLDIATTARLLGDPARAAMLARMLDGSAVPAGELAREAGVTAPTASGHLAKMLAAELITVVTSGRHRYYRLANQAVAAALETLGTLRPSPKSTRVPARLRFARTCYDHLAGLLGVALARALVERGHLKASADAFLSTDSGDDLLRRLTGGEANSATSGRSCLDWSERQPHVGGALGARWLSALLHRGFVTRGRTPRSLSLQAEGQRWLLRELGLRLPLST